MISQGTNFTLKYTTSKRFINHPPKECLFKYINSDHLSNISHLTMSMMFIHIIKKVQLLLLAFAPRLCNSEIMMENITVLKESTTVLTCPIHGAPTPEFKWYKGE